MERHVYEHYINNGLQHDFTGIEPGTIVGVELMGAFIITPELPTDTEADIGFAYNLNTSSLKYCFLKDDKPTILLMEVIDEHTGKEITTELEFFVGDENIKSYIEKGLHDYDVTEEFEAELLNKNSEHPLVLNPMSIIKIKDEETKKQILEECHNSSCYNVDWLFSRARYEFQREMLHNIFNDNEKMKLLKKQWDVLKNKIEIIERIRNKVLVKEDALKKEVSKIDKRSTLLNSSIDEIMQGCVWSKTKTK